MSLSYFFNLSSTRRDKNNKNITDLHNIKLRDQVAKVNVWTEKQQ